jgi:hypothetical protein
MTDLPGSTYFPTFAPTGLDTPHLLTGVQIGSCHTAPTNREDGGFFLTWQTPGLSDPAKSVTAYRLHLQSIHRDAGKTMVAGINYAKNATDQFCFDDQNVCDIDVYE